MLKAYIDGACEPNPGGTASYGVLVVRKAPKDTIVEELTEVGFTIPNSEYRERWKLVWESSGIAGLGSKMSNNVAEYVALIVLLGWFDNQVAENMTILSDSRLLVNQMQLNWNADSTKLYFPYYGEALTLIMSERIGNLVSFKWIPREQNLADALAVKALAEVGIVRRSR